MHYLKIYEHCELADYRKIYGHCELADYCKIHGHCNVPRNYSENSVTAKRFQRKLRHKGNKSFMTNIQIQGLESLGFVWDSPGAAPQKNRLRELAEYRKTAAPIFRSRLH